MTCYFLAVPHNCSIWIMNPQRLPFRLWSKMSCRDRSVLAGAFSLSTDPIPANVVHFVRAHFCPAVRSHTASKIDARKGTPLPKIVRETERLGKINTITAIDLYYVFFGSVLMALFPYDLVLFRNCPYLWQHSHPQNLTAFTSSRLTQSTEWSGSAPCSRWRR